MAKICDNCGKTYNKAQHVNKLRGQYNRNGIKIQNPNLQVKNIEGVKKILCSSCIKKMTKIRKSYKKKEKANQ